MTKMPWVRFFPSDWLGGTRGMSAVETGVYITLIATMYERGEPIVEDIPRLARLCGASNSAFKKSLETLLDDGKITRTDRGLWNDRVEKEQVYLSEKSDVGSRAANARWNKKGNENNTRDYADALQAQSDGNANQKPDTRDNSSSLRSEETRTARKRAQRMPDDFEPDIDFAVGEGLTASEAKAEVSKMRDWSKSSPNGAKLDWPATWRGWVRRAVENRRVPVAQAPPRQTAFQERHNAAIAAFDRKLGKSSDDEFTGNTLDLGSTDWRASGPTRTGH